MVMQSYAGILFFDLMKFLYSVTIYFMQRSRQPVSLKQAYDRVSQCVFPVYSMLLLMHFFGSVIISL